ncbi:unnamed protein product [Ilex paraguariensis]|uniref:Uncharacterized protein n=1 Tax=Ilex paraguariensis TaxID=185542 RepID=A0ABC8UHM7_9AQUA
MIVDGCFLLKIFRAAIQTPADYDAEDPIFGNHGKLHIMPFIKRDMLVLGEVTDCFGEVCSLTTPNTVVALPLSTNSRWIVDESGQRVKLACVNWVSHLEAMVAEGLSKQPVDSISKKIVDMGFNCVRLTWPLFLFTNDSLASLTVRQSFQSLGLIESVAGFQANNPSIVDLSLVNAYQVKLFLFLLRV